MLSIRNLASLLLIAAAADSAPADTITSTAAGGPWFSGSTWIGGVVPVAGDDVVIAGPVTVAGIAACRNAEVLPSGAVNGTVVAPPRIFRVSGDVANSGSVGAVNSFYLDVEVGGDLYNAGSWTPYRTRLTGGGPHDISQAPGHGLATDLAFASGATGDLVATTPITMSGAVDVSAGRLVLQPGCQLTLDAASFSGNLLAGGNELRFLSWSYLQVCSIDDAVLVGTARASGVTATTRLTVMDVLENTTHTGGGSVIVEGDLINHGLIRNVQYSFLVRVTGNVENNGNIDCPQLELTGAGAVHHMEMGPDGIVNAPVFLPEFQAATLVADTPVRFGDGLALGIGTLILQPGCSLAFVTYGGLGSGTVLAGGNEITVSGSGGIASVTIDHGVFGERAAVYGENLFTGGLTVNGIVESYAWASADLTVEGTLQNNGEIRDGAHPVRVRALGDIVNHGAFTNARVVLAGAVDQTVGAGPLGLAVPEFIIESGLAAESYQWFRDGAPLPGEAGANLTLSMVGPADYGTYHCEAGSQVSRNVIIAETAGTSGVFGGAAATVLLENQPNPFRPATTFAFSLPATSHVSLAVYDLSGREVAVVMERELGSGRHHVPWDATGLPSGLYVYRLRAGDLSLSGKCTLLR